MFSSNNGERINPTTRGANGNLKYFIIKPTIPKAIITVMSNTLLLAEDAPT